MIPPNHAFLKNLLYLSTLYSPRRMTPILCHFILPYFIAIFLKNSGRSARGYFAAESSCFTSFYLNTVSLWTYICSFEANVSCCMHFKVNEHFKH